MSLAQSVTYSEVMSLRMLSMRVYPSGHLSDFPNGYISACINSDHPSTLNFDLSGAIHLRNRLDDMIAMFQALKSTTQEPPKKKDVYPSDCGDLIQPVVTPEPVKKAELAKTTKCGKVALPTFSCFHSLEA
jgi:hypothetical protein